MKMIVQDINELTDSKEVLQSKPHPFTLIFIYIVLALLLSFFLWAFISEKEIVVRAQGRVKPMESVYKVTNLIASKVKNINFKNGNKVKNGQVLYELDHTDLDIQKQAIEKALKETKLDISNLDKLKKSVLDNTNYFNKDNKDEEEYYNKYLNYEKNNIIPLSDSKGLESSAEEIRDKISNLDTLKKAINSGSKYTGSSNLCLDQYKNFKLSEETYKNKIDKTEKLYTDLKNNKDTNKEDIKSIDNELNQYRIELKKFKSDFQLNIDSNIEQLREKLKDLKLNLDKFNENNNLNKEKNRSAVLVQIDDNVKANKQKLDELENKLKELNLNIKRCIIKANKDGYIDIQSEVKIGDVLQPGQSIVNIIPDQSKYSIDLYIQDKDIANIKEGQNIKYKFPSLSYKEYGVLPGKIKTISKDSKVIKENGLSIYTAESSIDKNKVYSHKGEIAKIKNGMMCEAEIITRKEKMLYYLLEKINLKN